MGKTQRKKKSGTNVTIKCIRQGETVWSLKFSMRKALVQMINMFFGGNGLRNVLLQAQMFPQSS